MIAGVRVSGETAQKLVPGAAAALAVALVLAIFHDTATAIVATWYQSSTFNHAFLIIPICIYLAWQRRGEAEQTVAAPSAWGILAVVVASLAWLVARVAGTLVIQELSVVCIVQGVILAMYGWQICRIFAFPLAYLFFAVPMGEALVPSLQAETARLAVGLLRLSGIPVFADGTIISIPTGMFQVAEECSGVRFLIASLALGTLFAGLTYRSWWRRVGFVAFSAVVPVFANGVRAFGIILLAYLSNNELAVGIDHVVYGWIFFTAISLLTLGIGMTMREKGDPPSAVARAGSLSYAQPLGRTIAFGAIALVAAFAVQLYAGHIDRPNSRQAIRLATPNINEPWHADVAATDPLTPIFASPDAQLDCAYVTTDAKVYLHIGYYSRERRGAEAVSYGHILIPDKRWTLNATGTTVTRLGSEDISLRYESAASGRNARVVWYWYWIDGRFTGNPYLAKLLQAKAKLLGGQQAAAIIAVAIDDTGTAADPTDMLRGFLSSLTGLTRTLAAGS